MTAPIPFHPLADLFPLIEGADFEALCRDIATHGLRHPIQIWQGAIIDGRNRYRALCHNEMLFPASDSERGTGTNIWFEDVSHIHPRLLPGHVISLNLHRRHLDETQRALIAAKLAGLPGVTESAPEPAFAAEGESANLRPAPVTLDDAARLLNVSPRSVDTARHLIREAPQGVIRAAEQGAVSLHAAQGGLRAAKAQLLAADIPLTEDAIQAAYNRLKEAQDEAKRAKKERQKAERAAREARLAGRIAAANAALAVEEKRYGVIYADPEWQWETWGEGGRERCPENHYPTSPTEAIAARPVGRLAADDCVLFLWATSPRLPDALAVMAAWGFTYKSQIIWRKVHEPKEGETLPPRLDLGNGYWFRNAHELLLIGTRGDVPAPAMGDQFASVLDAPVGAHSAKPERFAEMIEAYFPTLPKLELNARIARPGWDCWGAEAPEAVGVSTEEVCHG